MGAAKYHFDELLQEMIFGYNDISRLSFIKATTMTIIKIFAHAYYMK